MEIECTREEEDTTDSSTYITPRVILLENKGDENLTVARIQFAAVFSIKLLSITLVFLNGPDSHLSSTNHSETCGCHGLTCHSESDPRQNLKQVVGTTDKLEQNTPRHLTDSSASRTKIAKINMGLQIEKLRDGKEDRPDCSRTLTCRRSIERMHGDEGDPECKRPVVTRVFENVT